MIDHLTEWQGGSAPFDKCAVDVCSIQIEARGVRYKGIHHLRKVTSGFAVGSRAVDQTRERAQHRLRTHLRSEEHTSELQSLRHLVCRLLLEKKNKRHLLSAS